MLERFLGRKTRKSAPPSNQIEVICPLCGAVQVEPRLVVTTFCRKCGEHLRIDRGGRVCASARINPAPGATIPSLAERGSAPAAAPNRESAHETGHGAGDNGARDGGGSRVLRPSAGMGRGPRVAPAWKRRASARDVAESSPVEPAERRVREPAGRHHYFKEVECFDCRNRFQVGRAARSSNCPACGNHICMEDIEISVNSTNPIRTRGDVVVRKGGNVHTSEVRCRDLKVFGALAAAVECSGEFTVRAIGTIIGDVRCRRLLVDKGCDVNFMNTISAGEVEVRGRIFANIECSGSVMVSASGWVHGDVSARSVDIEPGGQLDGGITILQSPLALQPPAPPTGEGCLPFKG